MMKRLIFIFLGFVLFTLLANAQATPKVLNSHTMSAGETYYEYTCGTSSVCSGRWAVNGLTHDSIAYDILVNKNRPVNVNARVEVSVRKGTADTYEFTLQGKVFANDTYASIIAGTTKSASYSLSDTIPKISLYPNPSKFYRYYRVLINDDNACASTDSLVLSKIIFKVYER